MPLLSFLVFACHGVVLRSQRADNGEWGYVAVAEAYDTGGCEVRVTPYAEGAEAVLRDGFIGTAGEASKQQAKITRPQRVGSWST